MTADNQGERPISPEGEKGTDEAEGSEEDRRTFLASSAVMAGGLTAGYGMLAVIAGEFLYPSGAETVGWMFVTDLAGMSSGEVLTFRSPLGQPIAIARLAEAGKAEDFIALSSVCPHLGCRVHWESQHNQFLCPCHNGVFDASGKAMTGPPADAGQSLARYPLKVENDLLFIEVPLASPS